MSDLTTFPVPTKILDPAEYPEFKGDPGPATEWQASATHLQSRPVGGGEEDWVDVVALSEITGADGAAGSAGAAGADGNTILSGSGAPASGTGTDGDYYLDIAAILLYGPKAAGAWPAGVSIKGANGASPEVVNALDSTSTTSALSAAQGRALNDAKLAASGGTLTNVHETIYYAEVTENVTVDFANGDVQYLYVNPAGASIQITLPADPGAISKAGILFVKNNTGKAHTWDTSPAIRFADQADADTVPTPAAAGYYTRYTCQWMDNNAGTGAWWVAVAGRDTA